MKYKKPAVTEIIIDPSISQSQFFDKNDVISPFGKITKKSLYDKSINSTDFSDNHFKKSPNNFSFQSSSFSSSFKADVSTTGGNITPQRIDFMKNFLQERYGNDKFEDLMKLNLSKQENVDILKLKSIVGEDFDLASNFLRCINSNTSINSCILTNVNSGN